MLALNGPSCGHGYNDHEQTQLWTWHICSMNLPPHLRMLTFDQSYPQECWLTSIFFNCLSFNQAWPAVHLELKGKSRVVCGSLVQAIYPDITMQKVLIDQEWHRWSSFTGNDICTKNLQEWIMISDYNLPTRKERLSGREVSNLGGVWCLDCSWAWQWDAKFDLTNPT